MEGSNRLRFRARSILPASRDCACKHWQASNPGRICLRHFLFLARLHRQRMQGVRLLQMIQGVAGMLRTRFAITHTTVQVEVEGCEPNDMYCTLRAIHHAHHEKYGE